MLYEGIVEPFLAQTKSTSRKHLDPSDKYARFIEHISSNPSASWKLVWLSVGSDREKYIHPQALTT